MGLKRLRSTLHVARCCCNTAVAPCTNQHRCKLLVVGGGTGGCSVAWRFSRKLQSSDIIVLEPSTIHYYQPLFTLVAAGINKAGKSHRPMKQVLPDVRWFNDYAEEFDPCNNVVHTRCGDRIYYEYMVVAMGLQNDYDKIPGLKQALNYPQSGVTTIYSPAYCVKTWSLLKHFRGGHAVFTFPVTAGKCPGAAQKIMYLADDYWRQHNMRHLTNITYNTGGGAIFGIDKYAGVLSRIVQARKIAVNCTSNLVELRDSGAVFADALGNTMILPFNLLHVTPPMSPPRCLKKCTELVTPDGYLSVDKYTLQHARFPNVYGIGDCISAPNSKTAAAIASQGYVLEKNLSQTMEGKAPTAKYNGYAACPMLTSYKAGILAEFLYDKKVWETFPFDQSKERRLIYYLKKHIFPTLYWRILVKGKWNGPATVRKIINPLGR